MVKKVLFVLIVFGGFLADARPAMAGCTTTLSDCYTAAAKIDSFWYRWASGCRSPHPTNAPRICSTASSGTR